MFFRNLFLLHLFFSSTALVASQLNELRTIDILDEGLAKIETLQRFYAAKGAWVLQRDQALTLSLTHWIEFSLNVPHSNYIYQSRKHRSRTGDIKMGLNFATHWFSEYFALNCYMEYNTGSGPDYRNLSNHPLEAYGHEEWRTGFIIFKSFSSLHLSVHGNLFYVFRAESENTFFKSFLYRENFSNDNLEINLGFNTDLFYPFVPFLEILTHFIWNQSFARKAPGSGLMKNQISMGSKLFFNQNHFSMKIVMMIPVSPLNELYDVGYGLGLTLEF